MILYSKVIALLLQRDIRILFHSFWSKLFDSLLWIIVLVWVSGYILPMMGLHSSYGAFILVSQLVANTIWKSWGHSFSLLNDIYGTRKIFSDLILPVPSYYIFVSSALSYALYAGLMNIPLLPIGKIILGDMFNFDHLSLVSLALVYIAVHIFCGFLGVWLASLAPDINGLEPIFLRIVSPLFFIGCMQFSWYTLLVGYPFVAYINLFNPFVYSFEGMRAAILGQDGSLSISVCLCALCIFSLFFAWHGIRRFKKRLDLI